MELLLGHVALKLLLPVRNATVSFQEKEEKIFAKCKNAALHISNRKSLLQLDKHLVVAPVAGKRCIYCSIFQFM